MEQQKQNGGEKIVEIAVRKVIDLPTHVQTIVYEKVEKMEKKASFSGYAKIIYAEQSPKRVKDVEPIMGNPLRVFQGYPEPQTSK